MQLQRREDGTFSWKALGGWIDDTTYHDGGLKRGSSYYYRARAIDGAGNRSIAWSDTISVTVPAP